MEYSDYISIVSIVVVVFITVFIYLSFSAKMALRILPTWINSSQVIIRLEIENTSKVRVKKKLARLQVLPYLIEEQKELSEWIPFSKEKIKVNEQPYIWWEPIEIYECTAYLYPGEIIGIERLFKAPTERIFFHVALQFQTSIYSRLFLAPKEIFDKDNFRLLKRLKIIKLIRNIKSESWTATSILYPPDKKNFSKGK
jgi:hypothetical protein